MNEEELKQAIQETKEQIDQIKRELELNPGPVQLKQLHHRLKEMQIKQLWNLDQAEWEIANK